MGNPSERRIKRQPKKPTVEEAQAAFRTAFPKRESVPPLEFVDIEKINRPRRLAENIRPSPHWRSPEEKAARKERHREVWHKVEVDEENEDEAE